MDLPDHQPHKDKRSKHALGRIVRVQHGTKDPYTKIANALLADPELSFKAIGVLGYLLSKPDDWTVSLQQLAKSHRDGLSAIKSSIRELKALGYVRVINRRDSRGQFMSIWVVFETRQKAVEVQQSGLLDSIVDTMIEQPRSKIHLGSSPAAPESKIDSGVSRPRTEREERASENLAPEKGVPEKRPLVITEEVRTEDPVAAAASEAGGSGGKRDTGRLAYEAELQTLGIAGEAFGELCLCYPHLDARKVRQYAEEARKRGKGTGAIIEGLRQMAKGRATKQELKAAMVAPMPVVSAPTEKGEPAVNPDLLLSEGVGSMRELIQRYKAEKGHAAGG